jgi:site-specific recombinase
MADRIHRHRYRADRMANLLVSFYLAIWVGLKSRGITFAQRRRFAAAVWQRLRHHPRQFLAPPPRDAAPDALGKLPP